MDTKSEEFQECLDEDKGAIGGVDTSLSSLPEPTVKSKIVVPPRTQKILAEARAHSGEEEEPVGHLGHLDLQAPRRSDRISLEPKGPRRPRSPSPSTRRSRALHWQEEDEGYHHEDARGRASERGPRRGRAPEEEPRGGYRRQFHEEPIRDHRSRVLRRSREDLRVTGAEGRRHLDQGRVNADRSGVLRRSSSQESCLDMQDYPHRSRGGQRDPRDPWEMG